MQRNDDGTITTSVHRKPTHTNQYLAFNSHHPTAHKVSVVKTLMKRASTLCSSVIQRVTEEKEVIKALRSNGYPYGFIMKHSGYRLHPPESQPKACLTLPYIKGLAEEIRRVLQPLDIKVTFSPLTTLRDRLVHPKGVTPLDQRTGIVYRVLCFDCSKVYIGQSGRSLSHHMPEHRRAIQKADVSTVYSLIFRHPNFSSSPKIGPCCSLIDDEMRRSLIIRFCLYCFVSTIVTSQ